MVNKCFGAKVVMKPFNWLSQGADPGFVVRGESCVGEGSGDRLRSPAGTGQSPGRGPGDQTTIFSQLHHCYQTKKT